MEGVQSSGSDGGIVPSNLPLIGASGPQGDSRAPLTHSAGGAENLQPSDDRE
jgi:hypothetical protein